MGTESRQAESHMWQSVVNYVQSLRTYRDLSPDMRIRRQVNARLRDRPKLPLNTWLKLFPEIEGTPLSPVLLSFLYQQLQDCSGLDVGRIRPSDRLIEDLQLPLVCWFDWPNQLCDEFLKHFQVDISFEFDESLLETVGDLAYCLHQRLPSTDAIDTI